MAARPRFVIASNRLPVTLQAESNGPALQPAAGGLAAALQAMHRHGEVTWVGWPGDCSALGPRDRRHLAERLSRDRIVPVELSVPEQTEYYDGVCNSVLWPVLHYLIDRMPIELPDIRAYRSVNDRFAAAIVRAYRPGDVIWIHDYHLMLAPAIVRMRLPEAHIGFFLHTSFPSPDVFRVLPWRRELLEGLLGASLIGFQTDRDARNFGDAVGAITEWHAEGRTIVTHGREVRVGTYPIEIDTDPSDGLEPAAVAQVPIPPLREGRRLLAGVDRLDYTKGITHRLAAYRKLLTDDPSLKGRIELLQVAVPSRTNVWHYQSLKRQVEALVKGINDAFGTPDWTPVRYLYQTLTPAQVQALYRSAAVLLVTSIRDGMNLVAKEYVAARTDEDGVLILSEFTGAADQLREALVVNPYSVDELAAAMGRALAMDADERRARMTALRRGVQGGSVERWVSRFTRDLLRQSVEAGARSAATGALQQCLGSNGDVSLVLMYEAVVPPGDGDGAPDPDLLETLVRLGSSTGVGLHIVSDRDHDTLDGWFDGLPAVLWAEHGTWRRESRSNRWRRTGWFSTEWMSDVRELFRQFTAATPGAFVDERPLTLSWKFGRADRAGGRAQASTLSSLLREAAHALGYAVVRTETAVEVRPATLGFARTLNKIIEGGPPRGRVAVFHAPGFDAEVRAALRASDVSVEVDDPGALRTLLRDAQDWTMMPLRTA